MTAEDARREFLSETRFGTENTYDPVLLQFLKLSSESFAGFRDDPGKELTTGKLRLALDALSQIPLIDTEATNAVGVELGERALNEVLGQNKTWLYRALESITQETTLQKITLRLLQAQLPLYAQILQGPLEYGRDIVVVLEEGGNRILRMYQLKCGDISTTVWRTVKSQMEEMFQVPLSEFQFTGSVQARQRFLLANGHAGQYVEPAMDGWFKEQKEDHQRDLKFIHLDAIVTWILEYRLINEFKAALAEQGIKIVY